MKRHRPIDWKLLVRYVTGECSEQDEAAVRAWIEADEARRQRADELAHAWKAAEAHADGSDVDASWERMDRKVREAAKIKRLPAAQAPAPDRPSRRATSATAHLLRGAFLGAAVVLAVLFAVHHGGRTSPSEEAPAPRVFTTLPGQRATVTLADGTRVRLNADSELALPAAFGDGRREVRLRGEALFEVTADADRPFVVQADGADVEVLGTTFGVRAYRRGAARVVVAEGRVAVRPVGGVEAAVLQPQQMAVVAEGRLEAVTDVAPEPYLAWTEGRLLFDKAPFDEVAAELERWYGLDVHLDGPAEGVSRLNASFLDEPLGEILGNIAAALNLRYRRDRETVTFYRASPEAP